MDIRAMFFLYWTAMILLVTFAVVYLLRKWYYNRNTPATRRLVASVIRRHGAIRGWKLLNNVIVGEGEQAVEIDHLVVAPFGVIIACDLHQRGNAYGELEAQGWIMTIGEDGKERKRETIENPYRRARRAEEQLRKLFAKHKVYSVNVEVIVPKTMKQNSYITGSSEYLFNRKQLAALLAKSRYEKDNGVKVDSIVSLFDQQ